MSDLYWLNFRRCMVTFQLQTHLERGDAQAREREPFGLAARIVGGPAANLHGAPVATRVVAERKSKRPHQRLIH